MLHAEEDRYNLLYFIERVASAKVSGGVSGGGVRGHLPLSFGVSEEVSGGLAAY